MTKPVVGASSALVVAASQQERSTGVDRSILETKLGYQIRMTDRAMCRDFLTEVGITPVQFSVLSLVATNTALSQVEVGEALGMDRASTMSVINRLESMALIEKQLSVQDKRMHALTLTPVGKAGFGDLDRMVLEHEGEFAQRLTVLEQEQLMVLLRKIRN